jgi:hypothetical protein
MLIVGLRRRLLPEDDGRAAFALADLGAESQLLTVSAPETAGEAMGLCGDPKRENVEELSPKVGDGASGQAAAVWG